ncbi:hypothetical protein B0T24DRAFT_675386 [Lasiosphaeria ovina]|uniref:LysM domain-containing protein n=1 Tax=Lasiosphaeria ovina TaxID=92902 RepID=A0AAE0NDR7_9PEZI|nr:hypothetical protein B0T24DRAFT_675386 [Lasiosphaeria ovina]
MALSNGELKKLVKDFGHLLIGRYGRIGIPLLLIAQVFSTFVLPPTSFTVIPSITNVPNYTTTYLSPTTSINISTNSVSIVPSAVQSYASLTAFFPTTMNDTLAGWTIPDLPDNSTSAANTTTTPGGPPGPTQTGVAANCDAWYVVQANDNCQAIVAKFGNFTLAQFYSWNPAVGSSYSYLIPTDAFESHMTTTTAPSPLLPSTDPSCKSYYYVMPGDSCYNIGQTYKISADELRQPPGQRVICVGAPCTSSSAKPSSTTHTTSASPTVPLPLEPSTDPQCTTYHHVVTGDTCAALESTYKITAAQVLSGYGGAVGLLCLARSEA